MANNCAACHGDDAMGPPSLIGADATTIFDKLSGNVSFQAGTWKGRIMKHTTKNGLTPVTPLVLIGGIVFSTAGCATAPKMEDRPAFTSDAWSATSWFEHNVSGLRAQIDDSAGYIIFPSIAQWGLGYAGGKWGRGMVNDADDSQIGWAAIGTPSLGLQAGIQGFKMLVVIEDAATLESFKKNRLSGSASAVAVVGKAGGSAKVPFENGVAIYQGANAGLMAGVNVGLDVLRYEPLLRYR